MKNRGLVLLTFCIILLAFLTSCKSNKSQGNNVDKPTAENQGSGQVVNANKEKSESNTYDSRDEEISRSGMFQQKGNWIYYNSFEGNDDEWNIYRESLDGKVKKSLVVPNARGFCLSDNWIFYIDHLTGGISKIKEDGTGKTMVLDNGVVSFKVSKEWIYYIDHNYNERLYKIRKDGTEKTEITLTDVLDFDVTHGDWIYYIKGERLTDPNRIFKIGMDGREKTLIGDKRADRLMISNDWIYYTGLNDPSIYKMRTNGSDETLLVDEDKGQIFLSGITKDWVHYYLNIDGFQKTYRIKPDGTDRTLISQPNEVFYIIGMSGDWIYTRKLMYKFSSYKSKTDGTDSNKKIKTGSKRMASAVSRDGWIYYIDSDDNLSLYRASEDGSVNEKLHDGRITDIKMSGSMLYFEVSNSDSSENGIYSISLDKGNVKRICSDTGAFDADSNFIYYSPNNVEILRNHINYSPNSTEIYKIGIDGGGREKIADKGSNSINVIGDWVYYLGSDGAINKIKTDGTNETRLASTEASLYPVSFAGDWIYYVNKKEIWKIKTDGTSNAKVFRSAVEELNIYGVQNGWIYIGGIDSNGKYSLFKIYEADPKEIRLTDFNIDSVNVLNEWVYFSEFYAKEDYELMKADGTERRIIK